MSDPNQPPAYTPPPANQPPAYTPPPAPAPSYGGPTQSYGGYDAPQPNGTRSGEPVPGRTLGIVALIGSLVLSFFSLVWLILGIVALVKSRKAGHKNGFALAAIIISAIAFIVWVIVGIIAIGAIVSVAQLCAQYGSGVYEINGQPVTLSCG